MPVGLQRTAIHATPQYPCKQHSDLYIDTDIGEGLFTMTTIDWGPEQTRPDGRRYKTGVSSDNHCHVLIELLPADVGLVMDELREQYRRLRVKKSSLLEYHRSLDRSHYHLKSRKPLQDYPEGRQYVPLVWEDMLCGVKFLGKEYVNRGDVIKAIKKTIAEELGL